MADELTNAAPQTSAGDGINSGAAEGGQTAAPSAGTAPATTDTRTFTQAEVDSIVQARLAEHAKRSQSALKAAADKAEADKLTAQGEYKTLAEQRAARIAELEPLQERADKLAAIVQARLDRERKGQPKHILALLDKLPPEEQLGWLDENAEALAKPAPPNLNPRDGQGAQPKAADAAQDQGLAAIYGVEPRYWGKR